MVVSTWLGDHQGRPSAPLIRCIKPSKYKALTNTKELELEYSRVLKSQIIQNGMQPCRIVTSDYPIIDITPDGRISSPSDNFYIGACILFKRFTICSKCCLWLKHIVADLT